MMALAGISASVLLGASLLILLLYRIAIFIYNVYFHPLRSFPGPLLYRGSRLPSTIHIIRGDFFRQVLPLHEKYGDIVRIAPNELAISHPTAAKDILGHRTGVPENGKAMFFYKAHPNAATTIVNAPRELHGQLRRQLAHGFSDKSMREQEPVIKGYVDTLMQNLKAKAQNSYEPVDICAWYNFTTFDVIGDLAFGESFGCLKEGEFHPYVAVIFKMVYFGTYLLGLAHYRWLHNIIFKMIPAKMKKTHQQNTRYAAAKLERRMQAGYRPDFIQGLLDRKDELNLTMPELVANSHVLTVAGSETTATLLAGTTYLLLRHPDVLHKVTAEIRSSFTSEDDITLQSVGKLKYLLACLDEAMRLYPPVPINMPRTTPAEGNHICGHDIPGNTIIGTWQYSSNRRTAHFTDAATYRPERWLGDPRHAADELGMVQPFSYGPRNCIGRNLAYAEMRLILARVLFAFDLRLADYSQDWMAGQRVYFIWAKRPLKVYLTPRNEARK